MTSRYRPETELIIRHQLKSIMASNLKVKNKVKSHNSHTHRSTATQPDTVITISPAPTSWVGYKKQKIGTKLSEIFLHQTNMPKYAAKVRKCDLLQTLSIGRVVSLLWIISECITDLDLNLYTVTVGMFKSGNVCTGRTRLWTDCPKCF